MALKFKRLITTLPAGTNTHTFTDNLINVNSVIEVYTDDDSVYPESVSQSGNTVTVTVVNHADFVRLAITINNFEKAVEYTAGTNVNITEDGVISSTGGSSISNLSDVSLTGLQGGNLLMYNHTMQKWVNANIDSTAVGDSVFGNVRTALSEHDTEIGQLQQNKQNKLTAGSNITIVNDVISATGGGGTASALSDLNDVQLTSPTDKNLLLYNSQMQKWVNANITSEEVGDTEYGTVRDGFDELKQDLTHFVGGDAWTQKTYNKGDVCIHNNIAWECLATTTVEPSASATTYWKQISLKELNSKLGNLGVAQVLQISTTHEVQRNNYTRIGNTVVFDILIIAKSRISAWSTFATIPLSPLSNSAYPVANIGNSPATVYVGNNGQVQTLSAIEEGTYIFINGSILVK